MKNNKAIIVDLDGTLANIEHRVHHVQKENKNWKLFNAGMSLDILNTWCSEIIFSMQRNGYKILFVTGRLEADRKVTEDWLAANNINYEELYMRAVTDERTDAIIKKEIYETIIKNNYSILFVIDDRLSVVKMWRELGLTCLQCEWGDF